MRQTSTDLERAVTFTGYNEMEDEEIMDEETWNWPVLLTRIFCFFLVFMILLCVALEWISPRFLVLAAIICGVLLLVLVATYIDPRKWFSICTRIFCCRKAPEEPTPARTVRSPHALPATTIVSANNNNRPIKPTVITTATVVGNPIQMVQRDSSSSR